ncbi:hypothetical protein [Negadavirga shengliensis]|uniref:Uncharacterized protein n=1 Tax=Negadavirga shengliensis TaxID=1389218 RepID=A0ABV9SW97_9BACT
MKFTVKLVTKKRFRPLDERGIYPHYVRVTYNSKTNDIKSPTFSNLYSHLDFEKISDQEIRQIIDRFHEIEKNDRRILESVFSIFQETGIDINHNIFKSTYIEELTKPIDRLILEIISKRLVRFLNNQKYPVDFHIIAKSHPFELMNVIHHNSVSDYLELTSDKEFSDLLKFFGYLNSYQKNLYTAVAECFDEKFKSKFYSYIKEKVIKEYSDIRLDKGDDINYVVFMQTHWYDDAYGEILKAANEKIDAVREKIPT